MLVTAYIALGANLGDREAALHGALAALAALPQTTLGRVSSFMENAAVGGPADSPPFLNAVCALQTELPAPELLQLLLRIEQQFGRVRGEADAPRTLDLDLVLYGEQVIEIPGLSVPHPRMHLRRFVLWPLLQIDSRARDPRTGQPWADALAALAE
jgi:2-amino-4-hydroxy-6-hydroxymethyldihydropteridine diphosphokinase